MCKWGTDKEITIERRVFVDACIADFVVWLNRVGIYTTGSCCGHGNGQAGFTIIPSAAARAEALGFTVHPPTDGLTGAASHHFGVTHEEIKLRLAAASVSGGIMLAALEAVGNERDAERREPAP